MLTRSNIDLRSDDGRLYITVDGNGYLIEQDPRWGISIEPIGMSLIPKCTALAERPDICKKQIADG